MVLVHWGTLSLVPVDSLNSLKAFGDASTTENMPPMGTLVNESHEDPVHTYTCQSTCSGGARISQAIENPMSQYHQPTAHGSDVHTKFTLQLSRRSTLSESPQIALNMKPIFAGHLNGLIASFR